MRIPALLLCLVVGIACASDEARACTAATGHKQIFFPKPPANVPPELKVLKVIAPPGAEERSTMVVNLLEDGKGPQTSARLQLNIAPSNPRRPCDMLDMGVVGKPAYVVGLFVETRDGQIYFYAMWLDAIYPKWREPSDWRSYIVDPDIRATAEKYGK